MLSELHSNSGEIVKIQLQYFVVIYIVIVMYCNIKRCCIMCILEMKYFNVCVFIAILY